MTKKRVVVHAECPACACGDISFIPPEKMKEKFIGNPKRWTSSVLRAVPRPRGRCRKRRSRQEGVVKSWGSKCAQESGDRLLGLFVGERGLN